MLVLATVWALLVMPAPHASMPNPKQFEVAVTFASIEDCDAAARKWVAELTDAAYAPKHTLVWGLMRRRHAPPDATVTFSCVERNE